MISFRSLSHFVVACEHESLGSASRVLGIAPSTLSASLKSIEDGLGAPLFRKQGVGIYPRHLAQWLYRGAMGLLLLEAFARRRTALPPNAPITHLHVTLRPRFAFGRLRRALMRAIVETAKAEPGVLVDPRWPSEEDTELPAVSLELLAFDRTVSVEVEATLAEPDPTAGEHLLKWDPWMIVRRRFSDEDVAAMPDGEGPAYMVPDFPEALRSRVAQHMEALGGRVAMLDTPPGEWPQLLEDYPGAAFLLPSSAIAPRLGVSRVDVSPIDPPFGTYIVGRTDGSAAAGDFLTRLRDAFQEDLEPPPFAPVLTERRVRYFNLVYETGRVSAAARTAGVAQPAMSQQIQKLEESLGTALFDRRTFGLIRTDASRHFALAADLLEKRLLEIEAGGSSVSMLEGGRLSLGILPSASHSGRLVDCVTSATLELQERYPELRLTVRDAPNGTLQTWARRGIVGLAIVETAVPQMPRIALDADEPLAVICDPRHGLLPPGPVKMADIVGLPLALPTSTFGLRQLLNAAAREASIQIRPRHEIDALPMLVALVSRRPFATVLPASAVREEIETGLLTAHPIEEPVIRRRLFAIYSGERSLMPPEREFLQLLKAKLGGE